MQELINACTGDWNVFVPESGSVIHTYNNATKYITLITLVSSSIGIILSVIAFGLLIATAVIFAEWRQNYKNQLIIQFMLARSLYTITRFVFDIKNFVQECDRNCIIYVDVISLMYTECALVAWMFVFSKQMNDSLVKVFNVPKTSVKKISLYTWMVPGIVAGVFYITYSIQSGRETVLFLIYLFVIKWPVLFANAILLIQALRAVLITNQSRPENNARIITVMIGLIFVFSFQQILMDIFLIIHLSVREKSGTLVLTIMNILALYHCAFSITFWVFGNANTRKLWNFRNSKLPPNLNALSP